MNLLLSNFTDENSKDLDELLVNYQEYFNFKKINNDTFLYLNIDHLKKYIQEDKKIKYRKFIFFYLENLVLKKKFKNYNLNYNKIISKKLNFIHHDKILDIQDMKNIKKIVSLIKYFNNDSIKLKNIYVYSLDDNLYADIKNMKFMSKQLLKNNKINFISKGFIINNSSYLKNIILILNCIYNTNNNDNYDNKKLLINTECNLIISSKIKIELFINVIQSINKKVRYLEINNINSLKNLKYSNILEYEYLFLNINIINSYFKFFDVYYGNDNDNNFINNIETSILEQSINNKLDILDNNLKNIFLLNWNNIIIDNISSFSYNNLNYLKELRVQNYNYINYENIIDENLLKNISFFLINKDELNEFGFNNYKYLIKNEFMYKNNNEKNIIDDEMINIENNEESRIISKLNNKNTEIDLARIFFKSKNKYLHKDNQCNIQNILKESNNNNIINNINNDYNNQFCCICMDKIEDSKFCILDCCHYFCKNCILTHKINEELNNYENKCPVCRYNYNMIYNIIHDNSNFNLIIKKLKNIIDKELKNNILIVGEYNEILKYIEESLVNYKFEYYKKNKSNNRNIKLISINYLKKTIINNIDTFIFFTFSNKGYLKYLEIKNLYNDYYLNKNKIKFYIFNYDNN